MRAVTSTPSTKALTALLVTVSMAFFRVPEEFSFKESPMSRMPYKNMANPPKREMTLNIFIGCFFGFFLAEKDALSHFFMIR